MTRRLKLPSAVAAKISGSGPGGAVTGDDLIRAVDRALAHTASTRERKVAMTKPTNATPSGPRKLATPRRPGDALVMTPDAQLERRRLAMSGHASVDLSTIAGTGPNGAITLDDVRAAAGIVPADPATIPAFTASGMDPQELHKLPQPVRAAVAAAPTLEQAHRLAYAYAGLSEDDAKARLAGDSSVPANLGGARWENSWPSTAGSTVRRS